MYVFLILSLLFFPTVALRNFISAACSLPSLCTRQCLSSMYQNAVVTVLKLGFEVFTAVSMKMAVFWVVAPCSLVEVYQR
jgi:hypothetical protein